MEQTRRTYAFAPIVFLILWAVIFFYTVPAYSDHSEKKPKLSLAAGICLGKAETLASNGEYTQAIELIESFIKTPKHIKSGQADHPYFYFILGNNYAMLMQNGASEDILRNAIRSYQAAVELDPEFTVAWLNLAKCFYESEDYSSAAKAFKSVWTLSDEKNSRHLYYAVVCYFQAGESENAKTLFNVLLKNHPNEIKLEWKMTYVNILFSIDQYKEALPYVEELAQKCQPPKQKKWQEILLQQYLNLKMESKALTYVLFLTRTDPLEPKWWKALTHIHLNRNELEKGLTALVIYGFLTPMTESEKMLAADLYLSLDVPAKASVLYQELFKTENKPETLEKLIQSLTLAYDQGTALKWIDQGLKMAESAAIETPLMSNLLSTKARIQYLKKSWNDAAQSYLTAVKFSNKPGKYWLMAGYSYLNADKIDEAETALKKAANYKEQKRDAETAIRQIQQLRDLKNKAPDKTP